jgi:hypothetical protein
LISQYFSGFRSCGIRAPFRGFGASMHRPGGPVRQPSLVGGAPIPRISLSAALSHKPKRLEIWAT